MSSSSDSEKLESSSHFKSILDAALSEYKTKTGNDLTNNSLAKELQGCESAEAILDIIQREAMAFDKFRAGDKRLTKWIGPSVDVLYTISATLGQGVGMVRTTIRNTQQQGGAFITLCTGVSFCECDLCWDRSPARRSFIRVSLYLPFKL
jgi:hypothetical protein